MAGADILALSRGACVFGLWFTNVVFTILELTCPELSCRGFVDLAFFATLAFFEAFLLAFFAAFFGADFFAAFFTGLRLFLGPLLSAARFFATAFLAETAREDLRAFFAFFLEAFLAVATTNSFMDQT